MIVATDHLSPDYWRISFAAEPMVYLDGEKVKAWLHADSAVGSARSMLLVNGAPVVAEDGISLFHRNMVGRVRIVTTMTLAWRVTLAADRWISGRRRAEREHVLADWISARAAA